MTLRDRLFGVALGLLACPLAAAELQPFVARYELWLDGKRIGESRLELRRHDADTWTHRLLADGTAGLARLARARSEQQSRFVWRDGAPQLLWARMSTRSLLSNRDAEVSLDWAQQRLRWQGDLADEQPAQRAIDGRPSTGALLNLQLGLDAQRLAAGEHAAYVLHDRGRARPVDYQLGPVEAIEVPAGRYQATPLRYLRDQGRRSTTAWYAAALPPTPVRVLQIEDGAAKYELRLQGVETLP